MREILSELKKAAGIVPRSEEDALVEYLEERIKAGERGTTHVLLVGPAGCGKSTMMERLIHGLDLRGLAFLKGLHYVGIHVSAPEYVSEGVQLPQEKRAELVAWTATVTAQLAAGAAASYAQTAVLQDVNWGQLYNYVKEKVLEYQFKRQPALIAVVLDDVHVLPRHMVQPTLAKFKSWARNLAEEYDVKVIAIATMNSETYEAASYEGYPLWHSGYEVRYMLGFSLDDTWNLYGLIRDEDAWIKKGGPYVYDIWRLTGGLPPLFFRLKEIVEKSEKFDERRFIEMVAGMYHMPDVVYEVRRASMADKLYDAARNPDVLGEPEYAPVRKLLATKGHVVYFGDWQMLLTYASDRKYIGGKYAWAVPALADYVSELAEKNDVKLVPPYMLKRRSALKV